MSQAVVFCMRVLLSIFADCLWVDVAVPEADDALDEMFENARSFRKKLSS